MLQIDLDTARRFVLGKQGLWPGRRWRGPRGTARAMRAMEYLQLDPLTVIARSHDLQLHSRVLDYTPGQWETLAYRKRQFFDWGGWLATRPMEELPHWRVVMRREREGGPDVDPRIRRMGRDHAAAVEELRGLLRARGQLSNRDFEMAARTRTQSYRGRKDSALALYYLWRTGEVMTHHRENFERVYALADAVAPAEFLHAGADEAADRFLILKEVSFWGLAALRRTSDAFFRGVPFSKARALREALLAEGALIEVQVAGWKAPLLALGEEAATLNTLSAGRVPKAWAPLETTTTEEAVFLAPLDPVSARGRAKTLFGFDYVWEVYKPASRRQYGYYTLPILWGDQLVGRFDSRLDRETHTLVILGLWVERPALAKDDAFAEALARGLRRLAGCVQADHLDVRAVRAPLLRRRLSA